MEEMECDNLELEIECENDNCHEILMEQLELCNADPMVSPPTLIQAMPITVTGI